MKAIKPVLAVLSGALFAGIVLAGCTGSTRFGPSRTPAGPPEQLDPVASSTVESDALPPLDGQPGNSGPAIFDPSANDSGQLGDPAGSGPIAGDDGSFATLGDVGAVPNAAGRDLSGGLSVAKMLGGWTVISGETQCRLNLTQTTKTGTNRYRASAPGCPLQGLAIVASWQLTGTQVQLFNNNGDLIGTLLRSGNRFVGTLAGGVGISMVG